MWMLVCAWMCGCMSEWVFVTLPRHVEKSIVMQRPKCEWKNFGNERNDFCFAQFWFLKNSVANVKKMLSQELYTKPNWKKMNSVEKFVLRRKYGVRWWAVAALCRWQPNEIRLILFIMKLVACGTVDTVTLLCACGVARCKSGVVWKLKYKSNRKIGWQTFMRECGGASSEMQFSTSWWQRIFFSSLFGIIGHLWSSGIFFSHLQKQWIILRAWEEKCRHYPITEQK